MHDLTVFCALRTVYINIVIPRRIAAISMKYCFCNTIHFNKLHAYENSSIKTLDSHFKMFLSSLFPVAVYVNSSIYLSTKN